MAKVFDLDSYRLGQQGGERFVVDLAKRIGRVGLDTDLLDHTTNQQPEMGQFAEAVNMLQAKSVACDVQIVPHTSEDDHADGALASIDAAWIVGQRTAQIIRSKWVEEQALLLTLGGRLLIYEGPWLGGTLVRIHDLQYRPFSVQDDGGLLGIDDTCSDPQERATVAEERVKAMVGERIAREPGPEPA